jgi:cob(I)alamin adenosyltransferase
MKIYTRRGDDGSTGLFGGQRVAKNDPRLECCGTIDELNAAVGWAAAAGGLVDALRRVQNELFVIGAQLSSPKGSPSIAPLQPASVERLEHEIDAAEKDLSPLREFILPGGSESAARLHIARAICRRAERLLVALTAQHPIDAALLQYVNRLSDWLFVQARWLNKQQQVADIPWKK